jgi:hypothetical protein
VLRLIGSAIFYAASSEIMPSFCGAYLGFHVDDLCLGETPGKMAKRVSTFLGQTRMLICPSAPPAVLKDRARHSGMLGVVAPATDASPSVLFRTLLRCSKYCREAVFRCVNAWMPSRLFPEDPRTKYSKLRISCFT